jgi:hypothetical protein
MTYLRDIQKQNSRSVGSGRGMGLFDIHHVEEHEACVVVFFFLGEWLETVLFVGFITHQQTSMCLLASATAS